MLCASSTSMLLARLRASSAHHARNLRRSRLLSPRRACTLLAPMEIAERCRAFWRQDRGILAVAALFCVLGALWLGSVSHYHGDERFYTDAALRMLAKRDWFAPEYASGELRLNKPLLSYWILIGTYATCGISLWLSRLPFLLAGACVVWLTGRLSRSLFPNEARVAWLASAIVACDVEMVTLARRSTPDILLILFATASLYGIARIAIAREPGVAPRAWFWIGAGLMVATKGGLGVLALVFAALCWLVLRARGVRAREFVHVPSLVVALGIGALGLAGSFVSHDRPGVDSLVSDQVGSRLAGSFADVVSQASSYGGSILKHFAPWLLLLAIGAVVDRPRMRARFERNRRSFGIALGWLVLLFVVFSAANTHRGRYLAPAHPILACIAAAWLVDIAARRGVRVTARGLVLSMAIVASVAALAFARIDVPAALSLALCAALAWFSAWLSASRRAAREPVTSLAGLALVLLAVFAVGAEGLRALVDPSPVPEAVARLQHGTARPASCATLGFFDSTASQIRVVSNGEIEAATLAPTVADADLRAFRAVLVTAEQSARLTALGYALERCGTEVPALDASSIWQFVRARDPRAWLVEHGHAVFLAR
jgi:4-amino-4-deoxy-L-arabinose transferase-like glycosyltransferase